MIILGITGGSGCGKTTVSQVFKNEGIDVIDTDLVARAGVEPGMPALDEIRKLFGDGFIESDGTLNRKKTAEAVFSDNKKLKLLNSITHKYIISYIDNYIRNYTKEVIAIDGAALIESGINENCTYLISVLADKETRKMRIINRDNLSEKEAEKRIKAQKDDLFYIEKSDYTIYNNGDTKALETKIKEIISDIRSKS